MSADHHAGGRTDAAPAARRVEWLFSYGTLRQSAVQQGTYGRLIEGEDDTLPGYRLELIPITNPAVVSLSGSAEHPVVRPTGDPADQVAGTRFALTPAELALTDSYEEADYARVRVALASGTPAWVYVARQDGSAPDVGG